MSDQERLRAIAEREQQATKGPWVVRPERFDSWGWLRSSADGHMVANCDVGGRGWMLKAKADMPKWDSPEWQAGPPEVAANTEFIAHARSDVPYLLSLVARQAQEIQDLRTERDTLARQLAKVDECLGFPDGNGSGRVEMLTTLSSSRDALREALNRARGYVVERMQLANPYDGPAKPGFVAYDLQMIDRALAETPTEDQQ